MAAEPDAVRVSAKPSSTLSAHSDSFAPCWTRGLATLPSLAGSDHLANTASTRKKAQPRVKHGATMGLAYPKGWERQQGVTRTEAF